MVGGGGINRTGNLSRIERKALALETNEQFLHPFCGAFKHLKAWHCASVYFQRTPRTCSIITHLWQWVYFWSFRDACPPPLLIITVVITGWFSFLGELCVSKTLTEASAVLCSVRLPPGCWWLAGNWKTSSRREDVRLSCWRVMHE